MYQTLKWLHSLDLSQAYANPRTDMANGMLVAEIVSRYSKEIKLE